MIPPQASLSSDCNDFAKDLPTPTASHTRFQWNKEIDLNERESLDENDDDVVQITRCYTILISGTVTPQSLQQEPFSSLSIRTLNGLRDDTYKLGVFQRRRQGQTVSSQSQHQRIACLCEAELINLYNRAEKFRCKLHKSAFRKLVLFTLFSPRSTLMSVVSFLLQSNMSIDRSMLFILTVDALSQFGNMHSYVMNDLCPLDGEHMNGTGQCTLLAAVLNHAFRACLSSKQVGREECLSLLLRLTERFVSSSQLAHQCCVEQIINPLLEMNQIIVAVKVFHCISEPGRKDKMPLIFSSSVNDTIFQMMSKFCDALAFDTRESFDDDTQFNELEAHINSLTMLIGILPSQVLKATLIKYLNVNQQLPWLVHMLLYPCVQNEATAQLPNSAQVILTQLAQSICKQKTENSQKNSIEEHEQFIILCATIPTSIILKDWTTFEFSKLRNDDKLSDAEFENAKWLSALTRQVCLLTPEELGRLFSSNYAALWQHLITSDRNVHVLFLQFGLQAAGMLLYSGSSTKVQLGQSESSPSPGKKFLPTGSTKRLASTAVRVCRAVCGAVICTFSNQDQINTAERVSYLSILLRFCVGQLNDGWQNAEAYGPCADVVTMAILNCIQRSVKLAQQSGNCDEVEQLAAVIKEINSQFETPPTICTVAINALNAKDMKTGVIRENVGKTKT